MVNEHIQRTKYVVGDFVMSSLAWVCYNCIRYLMGAVHGTYSSLFQFITSQNVLLGCVAFPLVMMGVYVLSGYYNEVFRKSRLQELFITFWSAVVNTLIIFFIALINDVKAPRAFNYEMLLILCLLLFASVYSVRCVITSFTSSKIKSRKWSSRTLIVGCGTAAVAFVNKLNSMRDSLGYDVIGYVRIPGESDAKHNDLPCYDIENVESVCRDNNVEEIIVVPTKNDSQMVLNAINCLFPLQLPIKTTPSRNNILLSQVRISDMQGVPLVDISGSNMSAGEKNIKRLLDIILSILALIVLSPFMLLVAVAIKLDSKGSVIYTQERVGYHNLPFKILKFRSMVENAESGNVPQLTADNDPRVTRMGRFMRKYRIDELPQFWNVLVGEMSIVGPRPERRYFVEKIQHEVPSYALLHQVRPGITSLGMVKYGYAQNLEEMIERLNYDLIYLENMSLINDVKIMVYTIKIVITGRGM